MRLVAVLLVACGHNGVASAAAPDCSAIPFRDGQADRALYRDWSLRYGAVCEPLTMALRNCARLRASDAERQQCLRENAELATSCPARARAAFVAAVDEAAPITACRAHFSRQAEAAVAAALASHAELESSAGEQIAGGCLRDHRLDPDDAGACVQARVTTYLAAVQAVADALTDVPETEHQHIVETCLRRERPADRQLRVPDATCGRRGKATIKVLAPKK
ncbi:MAG: hypothetical protein F4X99_09520 [Gammaproteobacteria bacterium]|nr:hypothetical protein [Gammaproteobacteria bacterium]